MCHSVNFPMTHFTLIIKDGVICVLDGKGNVWIELKDQSIKKEELKCLLVTTGWGGQGIWRISKKNCRAKIYCWRQN